MSILVITDDRALIRYHVNALGGEANLPVIDENIKTRDRVTKRNKEASKAKQKSTQDKAKSSKDIKPKVKAEIKE